MLEDTTEIIMYRTLGFEFPIQWEDLIPLDPESSLPNFTLYTRKEFNDQKDPEGFDEANNWYDIIIDVEVIAKEKAIEVIAKTLNVDPARVDISEI